MRMGLHNFYVSYRSSELAKSLENPTFFPTHFRRVKRSCRWPLDIIFGGDSRFGRGRGGIEANNDRRRFVISRSNEKKKNLKDDALR